MEIYLSLTHGREMPSSTSIRKAERDRCRSMDPGALDFVAGEEADIEEEVDGFEMDWMKFK